MHQLGIEVAAIADEVTGDAPHAALAELAGEVAELARRVLVARPRDLVIGGVASLAEGRVAAAVEDQVAAQFPVLDRSGAVE